VTRCSGLAAASLVAVETSRLTQQEWPCMADWARTTTSHLAYLYTSRAHAATLSQSHHLTPCLPVHRQNTKKRCSA